MLYAPPPYDVLEAMLDEVIAELAPAPSASWLTAPAANDTVRHEGGVQ